MPNIDERCFMHEPAQSELNRLRHELAETRRTVAALRAVYEKSVRALREKDAELEQLRAGVEAVNVLIESSEGVAGLHLNGDLAPWVELLAGGRFEGWLAPLSAAMCGGEVMPEKLVANG